MAERKTGALMERARALGALFGGESPERVEHFRSFGALLGLAFQHVDDVLGIWGDLTVTGKPVRADLHSQNKSLSIVAALTSRTPAGSELAKLYQRDQQLSDTDLLYAADLIDIAGGRVWSQSQVDDLLAQAMRDLEPASPIPRTARKLGALARLATHRDN